jgi:geranylgeranyl reductase family protein
MESCDAVVVGGGPAGSSCAAVLARAGFDVIVLDKSDFPRDKVCAGWITPQVVETLQIDLDDYRHTRTLQPINAFVTGLARRPAAIVRYDHIVSYGIRRYEFDEYLLRRCRARLKLGEPLRTLERQRDRWLINGSIEASFVVGAGGHFCPVAKFLGANVGRDERAIAAQEIEFEMDASQARQCGVEPSTPELYFCDDLKGYAWCFRKGNYLNIGLGREDNHGLAEALKSFCAGLTAQGKIPAVPPARFKGHAYLLSTQSQRALVDDGVLLAGDAVGLAYPQSGEGILPAIESGILAARTAIAANRNYSRDQLGIYESRLRERFGARNSSAVVMAPSRIRMALARSLLQTRWFTQHVVLNRWFLHARQRPLAVGA